MTVKFLQLIHKEFFFSKWKVDPHLGVNTEVEFRDFTLHLIIPDFIFKAKSRQLLIAWGYHKLEID